MKAVNDRELLTILDFGSPQAHVIARKVRAAQVYCEILPYNIPAAELKRLNPRGIVLMPASCACLMPDSGIFDLGIPVLGIGYGMAVIAASRGAELPVKVKPGPQRVSIKNAGRLFEGLDLHGGTAVMEDFYAPDTAPEGFSVLASADSIPVAAMALEEKGLYGLAFQPESKQAVRVWRNFLIDICGFSGDWSMSQYGRDAAEAARQLVKDKQVLLGLSGGVDSAVTAALLNETLGDQLTCVFVNHGLLRKNEVEEVEAVFRPLMGERLICVDAADRFLSRLKGVTDPEQKRKIIGGEFVAVFSEVAKGLSKLDFLAQGTIYPDVAESGVGSSKLIKSHHNVGGLPEDMPFCGVVEPLRYLFKDEVRSLGRELGLPESMIIRQPFPGPGLGIRVIGEITAEKLHIVRESDYILRQEIDKSGVSADQYFTVLTGIKSVGVENEGRSYDYTVALRVINTDDFTNADWVRLPYEVLDTVSRRITDEVRQVNRVVFDITSKPPASIEWE